MDRHTAPIGYAFASGVNREMYCLRCGANIHSASAHDEFHKALERAIPQFKIIFGSDS